jgi:transposase
LRLRRVPEGSRCRHCTQSRPRAERSRRVLLREIRWRGYDSGVTQLTEYLGPIRPQLPVEPIVRFETDPGKQLQIDFVDFRRGLLPLRAFTAELAYSRYAFVEFADNERTETLVACLERALEFFGGITEHVLCDNPKTILIE